MSERRLRIEPARPADAPALLRIAREIALDGTTYVFAADVSDQELLDYWLAPQAATFVARADADVVGCYLLRQNHAGRGAHVANASYAVASAARGGGVGLALGEHSIEEARRRGFLAMQFNLVVATNQAAIALWRRLGFETVGRLPQVFRHPSLGLVDALVMHRFL